VVTVHESLASAGKSEDVGGLAYLNALAHNTPSAANIRRYAEIVRERSMLRKLVTVADEISADAFNPQGKEARQLLDEAESKVFKIAQEGALPPRRRFRCHWRSNWLHRPGPHDIWPAAGGSDHRRRPAIHGQDLVFHEYRGACRH
jgi:hypothetical protein